MYFFLVYNSIYTSVYTWCIYQVYTLVYIYQVYTLVGCGLSQLKLIKCGKHIDHYRVITTYMALLEKLFVLLPAFLDSNREYKSFKNKWGTIGNTLSRWISGSYEFYFSLYSFCFQYIQLVYTLGICTGVYTDIYIDLYYLCYICWCLVIYTPMYIPVYTLVYILCTLVIYTTLRFMQRPSSEIRS